MHAILRQLLFVSCVLVLPARPGWSQTVAKDSAAITADEIVRRWAEAVGGEKLRTIRNVYDRGTYDGTYGHGMDEEWQTRLGQRKQLNTVESGERLHVFDGRYGWTRSRTGEVRPLSTRESAAQADTAVIGSFGHLVPGENSRFHFEYQGVDASGCCYLLRMTSRSGPAHTWYIDRQNYLPVKEVGDPPLNFTVEFDRWKDFDAIKLPARLVITAATGYASTFTLETASFNVALPHDFFGRPKELAHHSHFANGNISRNIPIVEDNGHVFVQGRINGVGPEWITLDTGAGGAIVDKARFLDFGIKPTGTLPAEGPSGHEMEETASDIEFEVPGASLQHESSGILDLGFISHRTGRLVAALLGYEFFENFVVEIDFARQQMNLYDPASYRYHGSGEIVPLEFDQNLPYVTASLKMPGGRMVTGKFVIALGSEIPVVVQQDFATQYDLLKSLHPTVETIGRGVGGADFKIVSARIAGVQIEHTLVPLPIVAFPQSQWAIAAENAVGSIGGGLLRHFRVIFDYPRQRMILERGINFTEPFEADMSGLVVVASGPQLEILSIDRVRHGSPAEDAGLQVGDQLLALDGKPVPTLGVLKQAFRRDGRELELTVKRDDIIQIRTLKLRRSL